MGNDIIQCEITIAGSICGQFFSGQVLEVNTEKLLFSVINDNNSDQYNLVVTLPHLDEFNEILEEGKNLDKIRIYSDTYFEEGLFQYFIKNGINKSIAKEFDWNRLDYQKIDETKQELNFTIDKILVNELLTRNMVGDNRTYIIVNKSSKNSLIELGIKNIIVSISIKEISDLLLNNQYLLNNEENSLFDLFNNHHAINVTTQEEDEINAAMSNKDFALKYAAKFSSGEIQTDEKNKYLLKYNTMTNMFIGYSTNEYFDICYEIKNDNELLVLNYDRFKKLFDLK